VEIPVTYDGPDLAEVARLTGLPADEVVRRHAAAEYVVAFSGFAPGFGYLTGLPAELRVPRRDSPRTAVPAGSVAVAGEFTGVYPRRSPGGWQLLGRTDAVLWDPERDPPALLVPGTRVRFTR
jgi:KipI family sensor histidine kinase inhibitor